MEAFEKFIIEHERDDVSRLLLSKTSWPVHSDPRLVNIDAKELAVGTLEARRKLRKKVPEWYAETALVYPDSLCAEQCSSSGTAAYKARLAEKILRENGIEHGAIADLTGGLGVDCLAFSKVADTVLYNDMNPALEAAARHNFEVLGAADITTSRSEIRPGTLGQTLASSEDPDRTTEGSKGSDRTLGAFRPDIIFMDPSRRSDDGRKVFRLEDCRPDVLKLLPELLGACRNILLKLSPMADISMAIRQLTHVREVHVVAADGECKELLFRLDAEHDGGIEYFCVEDGKVLMFSEEELNLPVPVLTGSLDFKLLFEPGKSLTKAGVFNALCHRFRLSKLGRSTHLYTYIAPANETAPASISDPTDESEALRKSSVLKDFGKIFIINEIHPLNKASIKDIGKRFPHSEVTARNTPMTSDELRTRLKVTSGTDAHIFGVRIDLPEKSVNCLLVCRLVP